MEASQSWYKVHFEELFDKVIVRAARNDLKIQSFALIKVGLSARYDKRLFHYAGITVTCDDQGEAYEWIQSSGHTGAQGKGKDIGLFLMPEEIVSQIRGKSILWKQSTMSRFIAKPKKCPKCGSRRVIKQVKGTFKDDGFRCLHCDTHFPGAW